MKNLKTLFFALTGVLLLFGSGLAWGGETNPTWSWTPSAKTDLGTESATTEQSITLNGKAWKSQFTQSRVSFQGTQKAIQIGANGSVATGTLKTSAFNDYYIKCVTVNCASYKSGHKVAISINGTTYKSATATSSWTTMGNISTGQISSNVSGEIVITVSNGSRAFYLSTITIEYVEKSTKTAVKYDANGKTGYTGTLPTDATEYAKDADIDISVATRGSISHSGYNFIGWNSDKDATQAVSSVKATGSDMTIYAIWTPKTTTVTLNAPDATTEGTAQVTATYGQAMPSATMPQWVGHTFNGFFDAETSGNKYYNANGTSAKNWDKGDATATLHAQWTIQTYNITYKDQNNASFSGTHASVYPTTHTYGTATTLDSPTKTGYTFAGWYENSECTGSAVATIAGDAKTAAFTLYAKWTANKYNVTFDKNNADAEGTMAPQEFTFKVAANLNKNTFTLAHNTFQGWATSASGSKAYSDEASYTMSTEGATLYAKWTTNQTTITLDKQGGSNGTSNVTATYGKAMPTLSSAPSKNGYDFAGYYSEANGQGTKYYNADKSSATNWDSDDATKTLYAYWTPKTINVTLNKGEHGVANGSATIVYNTTNWTAFTAVEASTGYILDGYYYSNTKIVNADGTLVKSVTNYTDADGKWIQYSNVTLTAQFTAKSFEVAWNVNGQAWTDKGGSTSVDFDSKVAELPTAPTTIDCDNSKVFVGWTNDEITTATDTKPTVLFTSATSAPTIAAEGNVTYYAVFANKQGAAEGYKYVSAPEEGKTYIIVSQKTAGSAYALPANGLGTSASSSVAGTEVTISLVNEQIMVTPLNTALEFLYESDDDAAWKVVASTSNEYLLINGAGISKTASGYKAWWDSEDGGIYGSNSKNTTYYDVYLDNANFKAASGHAGSVFAYEKLSATYTNYVTTCCTPHNVNKGSMSIGGFTATPSSACAGTTIQLTPESVIGYNFSGWTATGVTLADDATSFEMPNNDVTLIAKYTAATYDISYDLNDGSWISEYTPVSTYTYGQGATLPDGEKVTKTNANFGGWFLNNTGDAVTAIGTTEIGNKSYTAHWNALTERKITYSGIDEGISITDKPTKIDGTATELVLNYVLTEHYKLNGVTVKVGESTLSDDEVVVDKENSKVTITPTAGNFGDDLTITFSVETIKFTVQWLVNGGVHKSIENVVEGTAYSSLDLPTDPVNDALSDCSATKFMGWATAAISGVNPTGEGVEWLVPASTSISENSKIFYAVYATGQETTPAWSKITLANQVGAGTYAIISPDESYYVPNAEKTNACPTVTAVTKTNNKIDVLDAMKWNLTVVDGGYNLESNASSGKYLWGSTTADGIRVAESSTKANPTKLWKLKSNDSYGLVLYHNAGNGDDRYLKSNSTTDWRNYTTSPTSTNRAANLYKLVGGSSYSDYITTCRKISTIEVKTAPFKTDYNEDETLDLTGLSIKVNYEEGDPAVITEGFTTSPENGATLTNETQVTITYKGHQCTQEITVTQKERKTISATAPVGGTYTVKVGDAEAQTITELKEISSVKVGSTIVMTTSAGDDYVVHSTPFVVTKANDVAVDVSKNGNNYTFTMPESDVTITAQYVQSFTVTPATGLTGGTVSVDKTKASKNTKITVTVSPNTGYSITKVYYVKEGEETENAISLEDDKYSFSMPQSNVTVSATFAQKTYTIKLSDRGEVTTATSTIHYGETFDAFPTIQTCTGYEAFGWTDEAPTSEAWASAPAKVVSYTVQDVAEKTFYAVYKQAGEPVLTNNYKLIANSEIESGKKYLLVGDPTGYETNYYAMDKSFSNHVFAKTAVTISNNIIANTNDDLVWTITGDNTNGYSIQQGTKYVGVTNYDLDFTTTSNNIWHISIANDKSATIADGTGSYPEHIKSTSNGFEVDWYSSGYMYLYKQQIEQSVSYLAAPVCKVLDHIAVTKAPDKVNYKAGESFDKTGMEATAYFITGDPEVVQAANLTISGGENLTMATTNVTVQYEYDGLQKETSYNINMIELKSIAVNNTSTHKTEYKIGQAFNPAGLKLDAAYNTQDGKPQLMPAIVEVVTEGFTYSPTTGLVEGENEITITYNGKEITTTVTAAAAQPYTVTFKVYNDDAATDWETYEVTETAIESGVKVPNVISCYGYEFDGWSKSEMALETSYTKETVTNGTYYPDGNTTLYATFSTIDGGESYSKVTDLSTIVTGDRVAIIKGFTPWKQMSISGTKVGVADGSEPTNPIEYYGQSWVVEKTNGGKYIFRDGTFTIGKSSLENGDLENSTTNSEWSISAYGTDKFTIYQTNSVTNAYMQYYSGSTWTIYNLADANTHVVNYIYKQGGTKKYTTMLECNASIDMYEVVLDAGNGTLTKEASKVLKGESLTLPTPEFSCNEWTFDGWCTTEAKLELSTKPTYVAKTYTPTEDIILYSVYKRSESYAAGGKVYKSAPSCSTMVTIAPESGNYDEAKTMTMVAGEGVQHIYYTDDGTYPMDEEGAKVDAAKEYTEAISLTDNASIIAYAVYSDGNSDLSFASFTFTKPADPEISVAAGNVYINSSVTITSAAGSNVCYKIGDGEFVNAGTNSYTYTFTTLGDVSITAKAEKGGLYSGEIANAYTVKNVARTIYLNAGKGSFSDGQTKTLVEENHGDGVTLVAPDNLPYANDKWTFFGWAAASVETTTDKPTVTKAGATYTPTADGETLYAVYRKISGMKYLLVEDFNSATTGNTTSSSGSNTSWDVDGVFDKESCSNLYEAGQALRLGKGNEIGTLTTKPLSNVEGDDIAISFSLKGWPSNAAEISVGITGADAVTKTTELYDFETKTVQFSNVPANAVVTFSTTSDYERDYLDNIVIATGTQTTRYATNPDQDGAYVRLTGNGAAVPFAGVKVGTDETIVLPTPVTSVEGAEFNGWISSNLTYQPGDLISGSITDAEFAADYQLTMADEADITINKAFTLSDIVVKNGAKLTLGSSGSLNVTGNLIIETSMADKDQNGTGTEAKSAQIINAGTKITAENVYVDVMLTPGGVAEAGWYAFAVPFEVDVRNGVYGYTGGAWKKLTLEKDYAIMDYQGNVRATGAYGWIKTAKHASVLQPGVFYLVTVADTDFGKLRFKKTTGTKVNNGKSTINLEEYSSSTDTDAGWNGIANPALTYNNAAQASATDQAPKKAVVYYHGTNSFNAIEFTGTSFVVGSPFFVQADGNNDKITLTVASTPGELRAPMRETVSGEFNVRLGKNTDSYVDQLYLSATEDATADYQIGHDMVKSYMGEPKVAQMYINGYNQKLCDAEFQLNSNNEAEFPLTITAPQAGEYQLYVNRAMTGATLYLYENGNLIWNLSMGAYKLDLNKGTNNDYTLVLKADGHGIGTGAAEIDADNDGVQKFILDERLIIIREGKIYDAQGRSK